MRERIRHLAGGMLSGLLLGALAPAGAAAPQGVPPAANGPATPDAGKRGEAYYHFTMGHVYEELYEFTSRSEYANLSIEHYKKAYELDPRAAVIGERLAEIYAKSQRLRDAVLEAQEILKRDPANLPARRLLARIYTRTLGDLSPGAGQRETATRAIEQYAEIVRLDPADTQAALWLARLYRLQNQHDQAEAVLRAVLAREPENEAALEQLAQLLLDQGRAQAAIELLEGVAARLPSGSALHALGGAYFLAQDYPRAEAAFRRAIELEPRQPRHRRRLAEALFSQQKFEAALEQYQRLIDMEPDDPEPYLRAAQVYRQMKRLDQAEEVVLRARQRAPGNLEVIYTEALVYEAQGRFDDAIRVLADAVTRLERSGGSAAFQRRALGILFEQLGRLYREVENFPEALRTFQQMQSLGPEHARRASEMIIDTYRAGKELGRALEESARARELHPQDRAIRANHALLLGEKGETDEAANVLRGMLEGSRDDRGIYLSMAQVYERGRRFAEAEQAARQAEQLAAWPAENEAVWFLLGAIYERQRKFDLAEREFQKALEVNPRNAAVLNYYGYMLADRGVRLEEAVALVQRALDEEAHNGAYLDSLGWAYFKQKRMAEAEQYLRRAVARSSHDPTIHDHLGELYFQTERVELAAAAWERALAEWRRALPTEYEPDKVAELEKKLGQLKQRLARRVP